MTIKFDSKIIRDRIEDLRRYQEISNKSLSQKASVSLPVFEKALAGKDIGYRSAKRIAEALGRSIEEFEGKEDVSNNFRFLVPVLLGRKALSVANWNNPANSCPRGFDLLEIIAVRTVDGENTVLGYGDIKDMKEDTLYRLMDSWPGGGFEELMKWGGVEETDRFVFTEGYGFGIGSFEEKSPRLVIGFSGCKIRFEYLSQRDGHGIVHPNDNKYE